MMMWNRRECATSIRQITDNNLDVETINANDDTPVTLPTGAINKITKPRAKDNTKNIISILTDISVIYRLCISNTINV